MRVWGRGGGAGGPGQDSMAFGRNRLCGDEANFAGGAVPAMLS
jgi:hypothetical protein